jgi:hypothetical protein
MYNLSQPNFNSHQAEFHRERSELKAIGLSGFSKQFLKFSHQDRERRELTKL